MPSRKLTKEELKAKKINQKTKEFMKHAEDFLASKSGGVMPPEWGCSVMLLEEYYKQFISLTYEMENLDSIIVDSRYGPTVSPLIAARDRAAIRLESILKQLGMTLKAASTMEIIEPVTEESDLEKFVKSKIEKR